MTPDQTGPPPRPDLTAHAERVARLFERALALAPRERAGFVAELAGSEPDAHAELVRLLGSHERAPGYLDALAERVLPGAIAALSSGDSAGRVFPEEPVLEPGAAVGRYRIVRRLAAGGMGVVYEAFDPALDRPVALKFLTVGDRIPGAHDQLVAEARAASALDHPNIAVVHEIGEFEPGGLYIAMGFYAGRTLRQRLDEGEIPMDEVVDYGLQLSAGLERAHEAGIIHRDVKPSNLLITDRGVVKIVDFGIASRAWGGDAGERATRGTLAYMSPEHSRGESVDARSDVWSAGVVFYEMLAGARPFAGEDARALIAAIRETEPESLAALRPDVPGDLVRIVERCLAKDPAGRYADAGSLHADLVRFAATVTARGGEATLSPAAVGQGRRRAAAGVGLGLLVLAAGALWLRPPPVDAPASSASRLLVLPPASASDDTLLARVGRELAVTLAASLDGIGELSTVDPTTTLAQLSGRGPPTATEAQLLAGRLGAGAIVLGNVTGDHESVRLDVRLVEAGAPAGGAPILGRATAHASPDSLAALTDSLAVALVRQLWREGEAPVPSLGAVTTHSAEALRHYVQGEQAMSRGDMVRAVEAFEAAFAIDSTFWMAYWRSLYPRAWEGTPRADSAARAAVVEHREELPEADRRMIEARFSGSLSNRMEGLGTLLDDFPDAWPAAYDLANMHVHFAPHLGHGLAESRAAIERAIALNPGFVPAWTHLLMITPQQGDTARTRVAIEELAGRVDATSEYWSPRLLFQRSALEAAVRGGDLAPARLDSLVRALQRDAERNPGFEPVRAGLFHFHGQPALQIRFNDRTLAMPGLARSSRATLEMANAHIWATRGAWDSASVALDRWLSLSDDPEALLDAYGLAVAAVVVDGWPAERADALRPGAVRTAVTGEARHRATLAWLDGLLAYVRGDGDGLATARQAVHASEAWKAEELARSLTAFETALGGDEERAARVFEAIELEAADAYLGHGYGGSYPYVSVVHRLHAITWLLAAGDSVAARGLGHWYVSVPPGHFRGARIGFATFLLLPYVRVDLGRIDAAWGRPDDASRHFRAVLEGVDAPSTPRARRLRDEAAAALASLREDR